MSEKSNDHRKLYKPDYFGWHLYCTHARLGTKRMDKHNAKKPPAAIAKHRVNNRRKSMNEKLKKVYDSLDSCHTILSAITIGVMMAKFIVVYHMKKENAE